MSLAWIRIRNFCITIFVIVWTLLFHYESLRYFYLQPLFDKPLPKVKWLFPPAGWIMFFQVDDRAGFVEVYGIKEGNAQLINPHDIFQTRTIGFDNIQRNILSSVADPQLAKSFCEYLERRFPYFDQYAVTAVFYPSLTKEPYRKVRNLQYQCEQDSK